MIYTWESWEIGALFQRCDDAVIDRFGANAKKRETKAIKMSNGACKEFIIFNCSRKESVFFTVVAIMNLCFSKQTNSSLE